MPAYHQALWDARLEKLFDDDNRRQVLSWLLEVRDRKRVIVVGAGFSKNAQSSTGSEIPNWDELTKRMARHLRLKEDEGQDPLELADLFETEHSRDALEDWLAAQLDDHALVTGAAHQALWESSPQAVITTNFLDTALEKASSSVGSPVYECAQLAKRLSDVQRHLIYFHGHRSAPETWVTSRRDYEDLPRKRPAIHTKVRQLLAEFPAVVVGYSMRDPDFHQIYRETARVLDDRHPPGLVVLPAADEDPRLSQMRAQYWRSLRVRFVRFRREIQGDFNAAYDAFFRLVELPETYAALRSALGCAEELNSCSATERDVPKRSCAQIFRENLWIADSALGDAWRLPFLARESDQLWKDALTLALPKAARDEAEKRWRESRQHYVDQRRVRSQRSSASEGSEQERRVDLPEPHPLNIADWIPVGTTPSEDQQQRLKELTPHDELVRVVEQALRAGAERAHICAWLERYLRDDYAAPTRGAVIAPPMLELLRGHAPNSLQTSVQSHQQGEPVRLGDNLPESSAQSPLVKLLVQARDEALSGNGDRARQSYLRIARELGRDGLLREDLSLPAYFAVRGAIAHHRWDQARPPELLRQKQTLESALPVRAWRDRVRSAKAEVFRARAGRNGFHKQREGYESRGWRFSSSPSALWREFTYAREVGAPLCVLCDLLIPLLGTFPTSRAELLQRLTYNLEEPGEWLRSELEDRQFRLERAAPSGAPRRTEREEIVGAIDKCMYPDGGPRGGLAGQACLSVLAHCPEVTLKEHLHVAIKQLVLLDDSDDEMLLANAWTGISNVCSWADVHPHLFRYVEGRERHRFRWRSLTTSLSRFPWRDWIVCDNFFTTEGKKFVELLLRAEEDPLDYPIGWLLRWLRFFKPSDDWVRSLAVKWLAQSSATESEHRLEAACALLSTFEGCPDELTGLCEKVRTVVERADYSRLNLVIHLAESKHETDLRRLARQTLNEVVNECQGWPSNSLSAQRGMASVELGALAGSRGEGQLSGSAQCRVLELLRSSWQPLPFVAELLIESAWSSENWSKLRTLLAVGDYGRAQNEWRLQRIGLLSRSLSVGGEPLEHLLSEAQPFRAIRESVPRAVVEADHETALEAMSVLPDLFLVTREVEEQRDLLRAAEVASRDQRVLIAAETAYTAGFLLAHETLQEEHRGRLEEVRESLATDPCAAIRRRLDVGAAVGKHAKTKAGPDE